MIKQNVWFLAALWMALTFAASLISIWTGTSVALIEIIVGVFAGNVLGIHATTEWIDFLALLGSGVLTFLAGAEIDPHSLKANFRVSGLIGLSSFGVAFVVVWSFAQFILGWPLHQAQIAGIALSTTSVAVVYAVTVEGGYSNTAMGQTILAACFITDLGAVLALGILFASFNVWLVVFVIVMCIVLWLMPIWTRFIVVRLGATRVSEPEVKFILFILFFLGGLATTARSEAVLPAYLVGLAVAGVFVRDKTVVHRMRSIAFAVFTPFFFIKAGLYVSLPALWTGLGLIAVLLLLKMLAKLAGVIPLARLNHMGLREATYTALLMATGITFGTISALFGLQNRIIDQRQYTLLVTAVILSAIVPTLIAQKLFQPSVDAMRAWGQLYRRQAKVVSDEDLR
jgi:Kef-type K+ transport system membrane component KefB